MKHAEQGLGQGHVDLLTDMLRAGLAFEEREHGAERRDDRGGVIRDADAGLHRRLARVPGHIGQSGHCLRDPVIGRPQPIGPGLAEPGYRHVHESWIDHPQARIVEPPALHCAGPEVLDYDVSTPHECVQQRAGLGARVIQRDAPLVPALDHPPQRRAFDARAERP